MFLHLYPFLVSNLHLARWRKDICNKYHLITTIIWTKIIFNAHYVQDEIFRSDKCCNISWKNDKMVSTKMVKTCMLKEFGNPRKEFLQLCNSCVNSD